MSFTGRRKKKDAEKAGSFSGFRYFFSKNKKSLYAAGYKH
ncbi:hypothetical protein CHCC20488_2434 [Bacillus paralicheniformis]|uniref:YfhE family protein n=1 Tax=Bacillus paralicheniformis TaxID=1648923 RepID=A0ABY3FQQ1_9BACI|nr:hypothetical protein CHCC20497_3643 [Bacillus paralicheniformis]TWK44224.1 hypothetical protein CHCC20347_3674 [Bacillus paralicheniformis]TWL33585.1 hypothetical protein CHCC15381_0092 [Bacillus paralicheniformis]TWN44878.1 hypothetical protein CHCC14523_2537 [Bacillus paralicheniformis]TWN78987.1 hypothetical protein CHCC20492_1451 [Bacillus paralicheniformis]